MRRRRRRRRSGRRRRRRRREGEAEEIQRESSACSQQPPCQAWHAAAMPIPTNTAIVGTHTKNAAISPAVLVSPFARDTSRYYLPRHRHTSRTLLSQSERHPVTWRARHQAGHCL